MALFPSKKTRNDNQKMKSVIKVIVALGLILFALIHLNHPSIQPNTFASSDKSSVVVPSNSARVVPKSGGEEKCDIFRGEWIPNPDGPYYTNLTCWEIHEHQNCMKYGRPDTDYLKWRWKPYGCDLPIFDPAQFLELLRGKSLALVGDSVGRNQMQSLICLLGRAEYPIDISPTTDYQFKRYKYKKYNFTLSYYWSPFLVRWNERDSDGPSHTGLFNLYLDEFDDKWTNEIHKFDYVIINAGHWFRRLAVYHENGKIIGCRYCHLPDIPFIPDTDVYRRAFRTAFKAINERTKSDSVTIMRTFAPAHFEGGEWNEGGNCVRRRPFLSNETRLDGVNLEMYNIQVEEFRAAEREGKRKLRLMDTTQVLLLRPDGHPSKYGHWPKANVTLYNDCVHWCLPGPIDALADVMLQMFKTEVSR